MNTEDKLNLAIDTLKYYKQIFEDLWWDYELPFEWSNKKLWKLNLETTSMPIDNFYWMLKGFKVDPFNREHNSLHTETLEVVLNHPQKYSEYHNDIEKCNLFYPIHIFYNDYCDKYIILDGVHRFCKLFLQDKKNLKVKLVEKKHLKKIIIPEGKPFLDKGKVVQTLKQLENM